MAFNAGEIAAKLTINTKEVMKQMKNVATEMRNAFGKRPQGDLDKISAGLRNIDNSAKNATRHLKDVERIIGGIAISQGFYRLAGQIEQAASTLFTFMGDMEKAQIAMEQFLGGDEDRAKGFIYNMKEFAAETQFATDQALHLSKQLMAAQFDPSQIRSIMEVLNDAASTSGASAEVIDRVVYAMNQIKTKGKIMAEEMRQLANANIPIYRILSEQLGIAQEKIMDIGDLNIDGDLGVMALLRGLEKEYKGTAKRIAETVPGALGNIKDNLLFLGEGIFKGPYEAFRGFLNNVQDGLDEYRKLMADGGIGAVFESIFPPETANKIRIILDSIKATAKAFLDLASAMRPVAEALGGAIVSAFAILGPTIALHLQYFARLTKAALDAVPALKYLVAAIGALVIGFAAGRALMFLWRITGMGMIATAVAKSVTMLGAAINFLTVALTKNKITAAIMVIATALLGIALASKTVVRWLDGVMAKINQLAGITGDGIFKPENMDLDKLAAEFKASATDADAFNKALEESKKKAEEAGKKFKKYILSFDEVFQIPEKDEEEDDPWVLPDMDYTVPDIKGEIEDNLPDEIELPPFKMPELPDIIFGKNMDKFRWPEWPKWEWPKFDPVTLPVLQWAPLPVWEWPPLPKWEWPPVTLPEWNPQPIPVYLLSPVALTAPVLAPLLAPVLEPVLLYIKEWAANLQREWQGAWDPLRSPVHVPVPVLGPLLDGVLKELEEWGKQLQEKWGGLWEPIPKPILNVIPQLVAAVAPFGVVAKGIYDAAMLLGKGLQVAGPAISAWASSAWESLKQMGSDMAGNFADSMGTIGTAVSSFWESTKQLGTDMAGNLSTSVGQIGTALSSAWESAKLMGSNMATNFDTSMRTMGSAISTFASSAWESIKQMGSDMASNWNISMESIASGLSTFTSSIGETLSGWATTAWEGIKTGFSNIGEWLADHWKQIVAGIAVVIIGAIAIFFAPITGAVAGAAGTVTTGVTAAISGIGLALAGIAAVWDDGREAVIKWGKEVGTAISDWAKEAGENISTWASESWEKVSTWAKDTGEDISNWASKAKESVGDWASETGEKISTWKGNVVGWFKEVFDGGSEKANTLATTMKEKFGTWTSDVGTKVSTFTTDFGTKMASLPDKVTTGIRNIPSLFSGIMNQLPGPVKTALDNGLTFFKNLPGNMKTAITSIPDKFKEVLDGMPKKIPNVISAIVKPFKELPTKIWEAIKSIPSKIAEVLGDIKLPSFSSVTDGVKATWNKVSSVAGFANGGIIGKESIVRVGEKGRKEAIVPLDNYTAMAPFAEAVASRLAGSMPTPQAVSDSEALRPLYVDTLIADERGLKELFRRFNVIEQSESRRGGRKV